MRNSDFLWVAFATGLILLIPLIAMQFTNEVQWDTTDFLVMGFLLLLTGGLYVLVSRRSPRRRRVVIGIMFAAIFLLIWAELAVGIVDSKFAYLIAADAILFAHVLFVVFVIFGLLLILAGKVLSWSWVRNPWFRLVHLLGIGIVVLQSWVGAICPLTDWEMAFRSKAGDAIYAGSFVSHWLERILYYRAPEWVFVVCYTVFGIAVLASWFWVRPRSLDNSAG